MLNVFTVYCCRRKALQIWKWKQGLRATYRNLLQICCEVQAFDVAHTICVVLKQREEGEGPNYSFNGVGASQFATH